MPDRAGGMRPWAAALALWAALLVPALAWADIAGQRQADFEAAVDQWLQEDEAQALPALARQAEGGNTAAQMLLALIDRSPALQGPWLSRRTRDERVALMRAPGGMSGRSWMHAAAEREPRAGLWLSLWDAGSPMSLPRAFAEAGEPRAAREALFALAVRERRGFADLADWEGYPPSLRHLVWREWNGDPDRTGDRAAEIAALDPGDPQRLHVGLDLPGDALADWLLSAPEAAGIAALCTDRCGADPAACARAAHTALASDRALLVFGTPSETLIDSETFHASPRGQAALLRRMLLAADARGRRAQIAAVEAVDSCLAGLLQTEAQRYIPTRD
ncbi:MAG: hypothetical protein ACXIUV_04290 [Alkalilacustris sp.]